MLETINIYRLTRQIFTEMDLTKCSIIQIIQCIFGQKCILFTNMLAVCYYYFFCVYIFQGSVATQLVHGGLFSNHLLSNFPQNSTVRKFKKSVKI